MTERQIEKIKSKIKSLRAGLAAEKRKHGGYDDSRGARYHITELYMKIQDYKGAYRYFNWFEKEFDDDICYPYFTLAWSMTLQMHKKQDKAIQKLYKTAFLNTYIIDLLCDKIPNQIDKEENFPTEPLSYAYKALDDCKGLITQDFKDWMLRISESQEFKDNLDKYISIQKLLKDDDTKELRSELLEASRLLESKLTG